ncbi:hypothetical protein P7C65_06s1g08500 [Encephalitozoon intestinalis]
MKKTYEDTWSSRNIKILPQIYTSIRCTLYKIKTDRFPIQCSRIFFKTRLFHSRANYSLKNTRLVIQVEVKLSTGSWYSIGNIETSVFEIKI